MRHNTKFTILIFFLIISVNSILALDSETQIYSLGDNELVMGYIGDEQDFFIGKYVTVSPLSPPTTGGGSTLDPYNKSTSGELEKLYGISYLCNLTKRLGVNSNYSQTDFNTLKSIISIEKGFPIEDQLLSLFLTGDYCIKPKIEQKVENEIIPKPKTLYYYWIIFIILAIFMVILFFYYYKKKVLIIPLEVPSD